jgi:hypothetical protein
MLGDKSRMYTAKIRLVRGGFSVDWDVGDTERLDQINKRGLSLYKNSPTIKWIIGSADIRGVMSDFYAQLVNAFK